jgi:Helix-turn-helix domain
MATITRIQPRPNTYRIDNIIVDDYGEKIGAIGIAVYNALARYADRQTGVCYPCIGTIARKLKLGRTTVKKYLRILLKYDLIAITSRWDEQGDPTSNSYLLLDPSPEKVALRRRQLEALLTPQSGTFTLDGGRSPGDPPPGPVATDPQSGADPEQSSTLNKNTGTIGSDASPATPIKPEPTLRQQTCPHPLSEIVFLSDNITICHHCYGLLDENLKLQEEEMPPVEIVAA